MLNIFWKYWKNKDIGRTFLSVFLMRGMCMVMVCGWLLLLAQTVLATPPLYPGMGVGHKDAVAPMHHRVAGGEGRLLAPGEKGIGNMVYTTGTVSVIALLVGFPDAPITKSQAYFQGLMDKFATYFSQNSYGKLTVQYTVASQIVILSNNMDYYGRGDDAELIKDAVAATDSSVDFRKYDALMVIHAGQGEESSGVSTDIHSQFVYNSVGIVGTNDGVGIFGACIVPEHEGSASPFGIFCHEFGHQLGLPDLYDTTDISEGIGNWSLMSAGAWNGSPQGSSPAHFDAWCKTKAGWITPHIVTNTTSQIIPQAETSPVAYKLWNNSMNPKEYFLVENRQGAYLPGKGLLIYHVDENQQNNDDRSHYMVALEQADNKYDLENGRNRGDAGDPYPGNTYHREFNDLSSPNSRTYDSRIYSGSSTYIAVENISNSAATMTAYLSVVSSRIKLISPTNGSKVATTTLDFQWMPVKGVGTYTLIIGTLTPISVVGTIYRPTTPLTENARYQWQVMATTTNQGTFTSDIWHFSVNAIESPPSAPILLSPGNSQTISQQKPTFKWQASTDPDPMDEVKYILWYSTQPNFGATSTTKSGTLTSNSYTLSQNMSEGSYYWKVKAMDATNRTAESGIATFTIKMITENGGTVTGQDGTTTVAFPKGAVSGTMSIDILMPCEIGTATQKIINAATNVSIATNTIRQVQVTAGQAAFATEVFIQIPYFGTTTQVAIYRLTPDSRWVMLPSIVNPASHTVQAQVYCFSVFGVAPVADYIPIASMVSSVTNWPNPFVGRQELTTIYYVLKDNAAVSINIYNPIGELVWNTQCPANSNGARQGANEITWDGKNGEGERVSQGIYFCVVEANGSREIRKIGVK